MQFQISSLSFSMFLAACIFLCFRLAVGSVQVVQTITVDKSGNANFTTIQAAINAVPDGNSQWIRIDIHPGVYIEQVSIPKEKQFILLQGQDWSNTIIQWDARTVPNATSDALPGDTSAVIDTAAFLVSADNFIAQKLTFQNTYDYRKSPAVALAAFVQGDKNSFYNCIFRSYQDTLCDFLGRHYFNNCWIEGGVDFIFGSAASVYEGCTLNSILLDQGPSWFTAHAKVNLTAPAGFVFKNCTVTGSGNMYLGRAWNEHSTVLFYQTFMSNIVLPLGWDAWQQNNVSQITYAEASCTGPGSNVAQRVPWEKQLSAQEWNVFLSSAFIDQDGWIEQNTP